MSTTSGRNIPISKTPQRATKAPRVNNQDYEPQLFGSSGAKGPQYSKCICNGPGYSTKTGLHTHKIQATKGGQKASQAGYGGKSQKLKCTCKYPHQHKHMKGYEGMKGHTGAYKPPVSKEHLIGDSLDQEMQHSLLNQNGSGGAHATATDANLQRVDITGDSATLQYHTQGKNGANLMKKASGENEFGIDDSEFYRQINIGEAPKDTVVENNLRGVLEKHMEIHKHHHPCKVPPQLYEKLPMLQEGIYRRDYVPQDMALSRPNYGDANNPWDAFMAVPPPANINTIYRKDYVGKNVPRDANEPPMKDVVSCHQDAAKILKAPRPGNSMYKVD